MAWEKDHHRLDRRRLKRVSVTPEEIGLCGCWPRERACEAIAVELGRVLSRGWQVIAVRRERVELGKKAKPPSDGIGYYATSLEAAQLRDAELLQAIRDHWSAIENGSHHRRDVSFGEDASGVSQRGAAQVLAALRNLALGVYELARDRGQTHAPSAKSRCRQMTFSTALAVLGR